MAPCLLRLCCLALCYAIAASAQQKKILLEYDDPSLLKELQSVTAAARIVPVNDTNLTKEIVDADAFIGWITSAQVKAAKKLRWVGVMSAGVEYVLYPEDGSRDLRDSSITLTNNKIVQGPEIADHALAMLLMMSRNLNLLYRNDTRQIWDPSAFHGIELNGKPP